MVAAQPVMAPQARPTQTGAEVVEADPVVITASHRQVVRVAFQVVHRVAGRTLEDRLADYQLEARYASPTRRHRLA
jgi:hypothetical protein